METYGRLQNHCFHGVRERNMEREGEEENSKQITRNQTRAPLLSSLLPLPSPTFIFISVSSLSLSLSLHLLKLLKLLVGFGVSAI